MNAGNLKRLVIFGCGYVGTAVALDALRRGMTVTALTRNNASAVLLREQGIEVVVADLASDAWHERIAGAPEYVLNCVSSGGGGIEAYEHSYVRGMASVVAWARRCGAPGTLVYTSSTSVYPQGGGMIVDENAATPRDSATERAARLLAAEDQLRGDKKACRRWFVLRLAGIYGPGRHHLVEQVRAGAVSGHAKNHLNLVHRDDVVAAIRACFEAPASVRNEVFNVVDDEPAMKEDLVRWLAARLAVPLPRFTGLPVGSRREITPDRIISNGELKGRLGWAPKFPNSQMGFSNLLEQ